MHKKQYLGMHKSTLAAAVLAAACAMPMTASACGAEPYIGEVCMTAASYCPRSYAEANGQLMSISQNTALFSLLGTVYGGNGQTTFGLPDLRGRSPIHVGQGPGLSNVAAGEIRGQESVTLTVNNLAPHNHSLQAGGTVDVKVPVSSNTSGNTIAPDATHTYLSASPSGPTSAAIWANQMTGNATVAGATGTISGGGATSNTGGAAPVATLPPQLGIRFCIAVNGLYPPRE